MDYADARSQYDAALEDLLVAIETFDDLFPPRNTTLHLRKPALNHRRLRASRSDLDDAVASFNRAVDRLASAALAECPDMLPVIRPELPLHSDSLNQTA